MGAGRRSRWRGATRCWPSSFRRGLYAAARVFGLNLPNWPEAGGWFFNPIAWQLVFTLGLVAAVLWRDGPPRPAPWLIDAQRRDGGAALR